MKSEFDAEANEISWNHPMNIIVAPRMDFSPIYVAVCEVMKRAVAERCARARVEARAQALRIAFGKHDARERFMQAAAMRHRHLAMYDGVVE